MLMIAALVVFVLFIAWLVLIYLRKAMWDVVHRNLLDLEQPYSGKIIRNGFAARPLFKGKINGQDLTINFSTARSALGRKTYIDFTLTLSSPVSITIAEKEWLKEQNNSSVDNKNEIIVNDDLTYIVMPANNRKIERIIRREDFRKNLRKFDKLAYLFVGKSGTICEFWTDKVDKETEFEIMTERLKQIRIMLSVVE